MQFKKDEVIFGGNSPLPTDMYTVRITDASKTMSKKGNPMAVVSLEIVSPETIEVEGTRYAIAGRPFKMYCVLDPSVSWGVGQLISALERSRFDFSKFGNEDNALDDSRLGVLKGHKMNMILGTTPRKAERALTPDEVETLGPGVRKVPIKDTSGNDIILAHDIQADWSKILPGEAGESSNPF